MPRRAVSATDSAVQRHSGNSAPPPLRQLLKTPGSVLWAARKAAPKYSIEVTIADGHGRQWQLHWNGHTATYLKASTKPCKEATLAILHGCWLRWPIDRLVDDWDTIAQPGMFAGQWDNASPRPPAHVPKRHYGDQPDDCDN